MSTAPQQPVPTSGLTGSLHYGGSINRKTRTLGSKPHQGRQFKAHKRLETIVRLENAGFTESATAAMLVISVPRLRTIKKTSRHKEQKPYHLYPKNLHSNQALNNQAFTQNLKAKHL